MVEIKQTVSLYQGRGEEFNLDEIEKLNEAFETLDIDCKLMVNADEDGMELIFSKR